MATKKTAPYRDKHFLEMSDKEREARKETELRRSGRDAIENVYPEEIIAPLGKALIGPAKQAVKKVTDTLDTITRPKVQNTVVRPEATKQTVLTGRLPTNESDVTHAYRNVSQRELEDIKTSKFARKDPNADQTKRTWSADEKWWSAGDETGIYGRNWQRTDSTVIRTKVDKVPENRAVRSKDLEVYNAETKSFSPLEDANKHKWKGVM